MPGFEVYFEPDDEEEEELSEEEEPQLGEQNSAPNVDEDEREERLRIPCFAHTLQLTVSDGLKQCATVKSSITKIALIAKLRYTSIERSG